MYNHYNQEVIAKRIKSKGILFLIYALMFLAVSIWQLISLNSSSNKDSFLLIVFLMAVFFFIFFMILSLLDLFKKKNAIIVQNKTLIIQVYKMEEIPFRDISKVEYSIRRSSKKSIIDVLFQVGTLYLTLNNERVIKIHQIKDVKRACYLLDEIIFKKDILDYDY